MRNDKTQVIIAVAVLGLASMYFFGADAKEIVSNAIAGLFGIAVGQALESGK